MGRGVIILLAVSLGLNCLVAGYFLNDALDGKGKPPHAAAEFRGFDNPRSLVGVANALPPESRRQFRAAFRPHVAMMRDNHRQVRALRQEMRVLVEAEEWDSAAVASKMEEIRVARTRQQEEFDKAFVAAISTLSAEDRQRMIAFAEERRREHRRRRGDRP